MPRTKFTKQKGKSRNQRLNVSVPAAWKPRHVRTIGGQTVFAGWPV